MFPPNPPSFLSLSLRFLTTNPPCPKPPNLSLIADKCLSVSQLKQVHAQMVVTARIHDNYAASRLLYFSAVSEFCDLSYAVKLFNHTREPNSFMWNIMIWAQAKSPNPSNALSSYVQMARLGIRPGKHTLPFVLKACSNIGSINCCKQIHAQVLVSGFDLDSHVVNGLIRGYSASGGWRVARQVFDEIPARDLSIWTSMICGYAQNHFSNESMVLFNQMVGSGIEPNGATLTSVLSICAQNGCTDLGKSIHWFVKKNDIELGVVLGTALVHMYASNGAILKARLVFDSMPEKNIRTWNAMIHGLAVHGHGKEALSLFKKLKNEQQHIIMPNSVTFLGVLSACCHAGLLEEGHEIFHSMKSVYNIEPNIEHYGCVVDLLGRSGRLLEAENLVRTVNHKADVAIWGSLLTACKNSGNIEVAKRAVDEVLALDPQNHGVHVVLSNIHADAGRWEDVSRLRKEMKKGDLVKVPGWSLVNDDS